MVKIKKDFEVLEHTADIKIKVYGKTLEELFCNAVNGMFQAIGPKIDGCNILHDRIVCNNLPIERKVELEAIDMEVLLVNFLSEALYLSDVNNEAYFDLQVHELKKSFYSFDDSEKDRFKICATLFGVKVSGFEVVEIKAVTYNDLSLKQINGVWQTDIVFDI
ncbi:MAG: hypothetical protein ACD_82C00095G0003 [uncultured bacterium]|jgi:SHS2 domain-containing protein|nr:MAG: hypothetical protein ACD_82C00095G0003 [uncultured bacterium]KKP29350.1 MAG: Protein archease [candidate division TM6 bacterium GW2011_GWF2_30_66]